MPKTVLLADDNDDMRSVLGYQLQAKGYRVLMAADGTQAVERARSEKPDIILLDVLMPGKDGTEAGAELKEDPTTRDIPVIFLTAIVQDSDRTPPATADRMSLPKSTPLDDLVHRIEEILSNKK